jgi:hypothetical protein
MVQKKLLVNGYVCIIVLPTSVLKYGHRNTKYENTYIADHVPVFQQPDSSSCGFFNSVGHVLGFKKKSFSLKI